MLLALHKIYYSQNTCIHFTEHYAQSFNNQHFAPHVYATTLYRIPDKKVLLPLLASRRSEIKGIAC